MFCPKLVARAVFTNGPCGPGLIAAQSQGRQNFTFLKTKWRNNFFSNIYFFFQKQFFFAGMLAGPRVAPH